MPSCRTGGHHELAVEEPANRRAAVAVEDPQHRRHIDRLAYHEPQDRSASTPPAGTAGSTGMDSGISIASWSQRSIQHVWGPPARSCSGTLGRRQSSERLNTREAPPLSGG